MCIDQKIARVCVVVGKNSTKEPQIQLDPVRAITIATYKHAFHGKRYEQRSNDGDSRDRHVAPGLGLWASN